MHSLSVSPATNKVAANITLDELSDDPLPELSDDDIELDDRLELETLELCDESKPDDELTETLLDDSLETLDDVELPELVLLIDEGELLALELDALTSELAELPLLADEDCSGYRRYR